MYCKHCGKEIKEDSCYCQYCGNETFPQDKPFPITKKKQQVQELILLAENNNRKAQLQLAKYYYHGTDCVNKDYKKAFELLTKLANYGNPEAQGLLGDSFYFGRGVQQDYFEAVEWYRKAAMKSDERAQFLLGCCYKYGHGVEKDLATAVDWFKKAADGGYAAAQRVLAECYYYGCGVKKNPEKAEEYFIKASTKGDVYALTEAGDFYKNGEVFIKNLTGAFNLYMLAAKKGHAPAQYKLGECYYYGEGVEKNIHRAVEWYIKAAENTSFPTAPTAFLKLGYFYENGIGVEKDLVKAFEYYLTAATSERSVRSMIKVGDFYIKGVGVKKDVAKGIEWYKKAAKYSPEVKSKIEKVSLCVFKEEIKDIDSAFPPDPKQNEPEIQINNKVHYLIFDTETTGTPKDYNAPTSNSSNWPRLVQLSWITTDGDCNILSENDYIIYPDGFVIPSDAARLHGITTNIAKDKGWPLEVVLERFSEDFNKANAIVGHNIAFDKKIVGAELIRLGQKDIMDTKKSLCTMEASTDYCKIPGYQGYKWPKLQELHKKLFGYEFEDAHNSMSDVTATLKCFKEMKIIGLI